MRAAFRLLARTVLLDLVVSFTPASILDAGSSDSYRASASRGHHPQQVQRTRRGALTLWRPVAVGREPGRSGQAVMSMRGEGHCKLGRGISDCDPSSLLPPCGVWLPGADQCGGAVCNHHFSRERSPPFRRGFIPVHLDLLAVVHFELAEDLIALFGRNRSRRHSSSPKGCRTLLCGGAQGRFHDRA